MIDEKKLIDELYDDFDHGRIESFDDVIYTIEHQPKVGEWIPVSEQKPGEGSYEVTVRGKKHGLISVETAVYRESCDEWTVNLFIPYPVEVIAWRKKPEPWEE